MRVCTPKVVYRQLSFPASVPASVANRQADGKAPVAVELLSEPLPGSRKHLHRWADLRDDHAHHRPDTLDRGRD